MARLGFARLSKEYRQVIHACMHVCMNSYIHTYMHAYMHTCIHAYMHTYTHTYIHTYKHTKIHTGSLRTYIHTSIHTYTHTGSLRLSPQAGAGKKEKEDINEIYDAARTLIQQSLPQTDRSTHEARYPLSLSPLPPTAMCSATPYTLHPTTKSVPQALNLLQSLKAILQPTPYTLTPCTLNQTLNPTGTAGAQPAREPQGHSAAGVGNEQPRRRTGAKGKHGQRSRPRPAPHVRRTLPPVG